MARKPKLEPLVPKKPAQQVSVVVFRLRPGGKREYLLLQKRPKEEQFRKPNGDIITVTAKSFFQPVSGSASEELDRGFMKGRGRRSALGPAPTSDAITAARELFEETGFDIGRKGVVKRFAYLGEPRTSARHKKDLTKQGLRLRQAFLAEVDFQHSHKLDWDDAEHRGAIWVAEDEICDFLKSSVNVPAARKRQQYLGAIKMAKKYIGRLG